MKKIFRNVVAAFAAVMLVSAFASCSDSDDGDDKKTEQPAGTETSDVSVWTGTAALDWGTRAPAIAADKLSGDFKGLKLTYTSTAASGICFKVLDESWGAIEMAEATGDGTLRAKDAADDPLKAVDLEPGKTDATVTVKFGDAELATAKKGVGFHGTGATITKVELVK